MLNDGKKKALKLKIKNIEWQKGSTKILSSMKRSFRAAIVGQSFL
jgi:ubiquinone/menaquinone biosynthesis C-methylase UbiE